MSVTNVIEKQIQLRAPRSRVWRALTDHEEFGAWFRAKLDAPFVAGQEVGGHITYPGYEHLRLTLAVVQIEPESSFSFRWHPHAVDPHVDYSDEPTTLVEFRLEEIAGGTRLTITESGFDAIPEARRDLAFRMNGGGWEEQLTNIQTHVDG